VALTTRADASFPQKQALHGMDPARLLLVPSRSSEGSVETPPLRAKEAQL
jgi:hypothetical protein